MRNSTIAVHNPQSFRILADMISGIELPPGDTVLLFRSDRPAATPTNGDKRRLAFSVRDLRIRLKGKR